MPLAPGETILDKYRILELIGEGSFARVWKAQEFDSKGHPLRLVAIKELKRELLSGQELAEQEFRFQREMKVSAQLFESEVPNVMRALTTEALALDDGTDVPLLILEYMPGGNLADLIAVHPHGMELGRAVRIATDICAALKGLHNKGIVHRDVKPSNILFRSVDALARLADFGTAQLPGETVSGSRSLGTAAYHPGSPDYMPDEQLLSRGRGYLQPSADIFALGCVLFEMLTGMGYKLARRQSKGLRDLRPDAPSWLRAVVAKALVKDPQGRWQSAGEVAEALERGLGKAEQKRWKPGGLVAIVAVIAVAVIALLASDVVPRIVGKPTAVAGVTMDIPTPLAITATPLAATVTPRESVPVTGTRPGEATPTVDHTATAQAWAYLHATQTAQAMPTMPTPTAMLRPPTSTPTSTRVPTATPRVITDPAELTRFKLAIGEYRMAEKAALRTLEPAVVEQLATFAQGEALVAIMERIEVFRDQGLYQELTVQQFDVQQAVMWDDQTAGVLVQEKHALRTYWRAADGGQWVDEQTYDGSVVYRLIYLYSGWKVECIRLVESSGQ